ncbi:dnaJ homolog subfamily C member 7-like [Dendronephthya gigantea]|uniref:dnaJ homolog subfamily C member 7-like n=1 Tax=Dendronephthya gigantea TaxID=151771 RepID=UPI001069DD9F|nr:dnaJ homolog subfamily C member 7-like [Dendronephthya gigantea]
MLNESGDSPDRQRESCRKFNTDGSTAFKNQDYERAILLYSKAIEAADYTLAPYFSNRAAAYFMIRNYKEAYTDASAAIGLDENCFKAYLTIARGGLAQGFLELARDSLEKAAQINPHSSSLPKLYSRFYKILSYEILAACAHTKGDLKQTLSYTQNLLAQSPDSDKYRVVEADLHAMMGDYNEGKKDANTVLYHDERNSDAWYVRGICLYNQGSFQPAYEAIIENALRCDPGHQKSLMMSERLKTLQSLNANACQAYRSKNFLEAFNLFTQALTVDPKNRLLLAKLLHKRGLCSFMLKNFKDAISDFAESLELDESNLDVYLIKAKSHLITGGYEEACSEYLKVQQRTVHQTPGPQKYEKLYKESDEARLKLEHACRVLSLSRNCSKSDVIKAFRMREISIHYPDCHPGLSGEMREQKEEQFREITQARDFLLDYLQRMKDFQDFEVVFSDEDDFETEL